MEISKLQDSLDRFNKKDINFEAFITEIYDDLKQVMIHRSVSGDEDILQQFMIHIIEKGDELKFETAREFMSYAHKFSDNTKFYQNVKNSNVTYTDNEELLDMLEENNNDSNMLVENPEDIILRDKNEVDYKLTDFLGSDEEIKIVKPTRERIQLTGLNISEFCELTNISRQRIYQCINNNRLPLDISNQLDKYYKFYNSKQAEYYLRELILDKIGSFKGNAGKKFDVNLLTIYKAFTRGMTYSVFMSFRDTLEDLIDLPKYIISQAEKAKMLEPYQYLLGEDNDIR